MTPEIVEPVDAATAHETDVPKFTEDPAAGVQVTVPDPDPPTAVESSHELRLKEAVRLVFEVRENGPHRPVPVQAPDQPVKV